MVKERYSLFQLIPDRNRLNTGSQGFQQALLGMYVLPNSMTHAEQKEEQCEGARERERERIRE